ncbi:MAG: sodium:proton antiporter [Synechococcaceae bacterium WB4_1_0192]|nr:sodium:proton antiporter [Synechococcaceae bacterium WB4_1_0192]
MPALSLIAAAAGELRLGAIPLEAKVLFIGIVYLGTLMISHFSVRIGIPAILGVLLMGLAINVHSLNVSHTEVQNLYVFALALLLFYAGLKTDLQAIRGFLRYGLMLAIGGVATATLVLGISIWWLSSESGASLAPGQLNAMPIGAALLIAACLGSTDAGATLSVLRQVRRSVPARVAHLLEFESSVNDPAALIIYGICISLFSAGNHTGEPLPAMLLAGLRELLQQLGSGVLVGVAFGNLARLVINRTDLEKGQLLVVAMSIAFIDFGCSHFLGGSGFVAVYVTGVFMTNVHYRNPEINHTSIQEVLLPFNTMTEISIFLLFGLLVQPDQLLPALPVGIAATAVLMLIARPLSVLCFQRLSPFSGRDSLLIAWCGLRGAVPLALSYNLVGQIPSLRGMTPGLATALAANAQSIVFIVVILNLLLQGLTLPRLCRWLNVPAEPASSS